MKVFKKIIKVIGILLLFLLLGGGYYIYQSGPVLPDDTDEIIKQVLANPLPELVKGETGVSTSEGIDIWYERILPSDVSKGTVLLIMGISNDALGWPPTFIQSFTDAGYQVIRYDHRGTGLSDWMDNYAANNPYSLADMAMDGISILDDLQVDKAHVIGVSMGGMIAQELAINHPNRVQSLTSIMSSGNILDSALPPISTAIAFELIKMAIKYNIISNETNMIKMHLASRIILNGGTNSTLNAKEIAQQVLYNMRKRKGYNANVSRQHQTAVSTSGSRYESLKILNTPTLIIHGTADPFIPIAHGKKCVRLLPNADSLWVENMGHDIPEEFIPIVSKKIIGIFK